MRTKMPLKKYSCHKATRQAIFLLYFFFFLLIIFNSNSFAQDSKGKSLPFRHYISFNGKAKYSTNFHHFDYVDLLGKKEGTIRFGVEGGFNSTNPFLLKGKPSPGLTQYLFETLTVASDDEFGVRYGLIAEGIAFDYSQNFIEFKINRQAKFHNQQPITADDVIFSYEQLIANGHPLYKMSFQGVKNVVKINQYQVKFYFYDDYDKDLPMQISALPIFSKEFYTKNDFTLANIGNIMPLGSGPYKIANIDANKSITYQKFDNYWGKDLAVNRGLYNFEKIIFDYYRDNTSLIEAFKAKKYDLREENIARNWHNSYNIKAIANQEIIKKEFSNETPPAIQAMVFNLRKAKFQDLALRKAISLAFNFSWLNQNIFYNSYHRTTSYFENSPFSNNWQEDVDKRLTEEEEKDLFKNFFDHQEQRQNLLQAQKILLDTGYKIIDGKLYQPQKLLSGEVSPSYVPVEIEFLVDNNSFAIVLSSFIANLKKIGISAKTKLVEDNQYYQYLQNYNFDMVVTVMAPAILPGKELFSYWHSSQAGIKGGNNLSGLKDNLVDELVMQIAREKSSAKLIKLTKKLDHYLLENHLTILQWHNRKQRVLYRNIFSQPKISPKFGINIDSWSIKQK